MLGRWRAFLADRRGGYDLIQFSLILPIFILLLYGSYELMKLVWIRQSLDAGTYQAARYLSVYHTYYYDGSRTREGVDDRQRAERLIQESLAANPFAVSAAPLDLAIRYFNGAGQEIAAPVDFDCRRIRNALHSPQTSDVVFSVQSELTLPWQVPLLELPAGQLTLRSRHTVVVDCGPWFPPPPTPTPSPTPNP